MQGSQSSCVGWAVAYSLKTYQERLDQKWALNTYDHIFSPAYIYNQINDEILSAADVIMTDTWQSMGEETDEQVIRELHNFRVTKSLMNKAKKDCIFMHCLPAHRNLEVTDSIIDGKNSVVWSQSQNRMYVQQSILKYCIS